MQFDIPANTQFACIAIQPLSISRELPQSFELGDGVHALINPSFEIEQFWQEELGKIKSKDISESALIVLALISSDRSDGWFDRELKHSVRSILYSLYIQRVYCSSGGILLCGGKAGGNISIRSVQDLENYFRPRETLTEVLNAEIFNFAMLIAKGLREIYAATKQYSRLKRGFEAWTDGISSRRDDKRIRQFVRSVEAVIKPDIGKTRKQFVYRGQLLAGRTDQVQRILGEIYDLRSCAEHMNDIRIFYDDLPESEIDKTTALRAFQAELLADYVYRRIFEKSELRKAFINDAGIDSFWKEPEREQMKLWGAPIDLEAEGKGRLRPYL